MGVVARVGAPVAHRRDRLRRRLRKRLRRTLPLGAYTHRRLGGRGRLGNQLFQVAGTVGIAAALGERALFLRSWAYRHAFVLPDSFFAGYLTIERCRDAWRHAEHLSVRERRYLQDISLWAAQKDFVWSAFQPSVRASQALDRVFGKDLSSPGATALHVRRGDYVTRGIAVPASFYRRELERLSPAGPVFIFSDDPVWVQRHLASRDAVVVAGNADWLDMLAMARCDHHICANSTFSWWGAFLSRDPAPTIPWAPGRWPHFDRLQAGPDWRLVEIELGG